MNFQYLISSFRKNGLFLFFLLPFTAFSQQPALFKMTPVKGIVGAEKVPATSWIDYKNPEGAFSAKLPLVPAGSKKEVPNPAYPDYPPIVFNIYFSADSVRMMNYVIRYNDYPSGMYLSDKSASFAALIKEMEGRGRVVKQPAVIFKDGAEGRALDLITEGFYMQVQIFIRGNRIYMLLRQNLQGDELPQPDQFFDSFKLDAYAPLRSVPFSLAGIELTMPDKPLLIPMKDDDEASFISDNQVYYAVNVNSGGLYGIEKGKISPYYRSDDLDSMYTAILTGVKLESDSVYKTADIAVEGVKGKENFVVNKSSGTHKRGRVWIRNDQFYFQTVNVDKDEMGGKQVEDFFSSVKHKSAGSNFDIHASKASLILKDLKSSDTLVHRNARNALGFYKFNLEELTMLHAALRTSYADDDTGKGTRSMLTDVLKTTHDKNTVVVFKEVFEDKQNTDEVRAEVLASVTSIDLNSYDWYFNALCSNSALKISNYWSLFRPLSDSLTYVAGNFEKTLSLLEVEPYRTSMLGLFSSMLYGKQKSAYKSLVVNHAKQITAHAMKDLGEFIRENNNKEEAATSGIYAYLNILPEVNLTALTDEFTNKLLAVDSVFYLRNAAVVARIKANLPIDKHLLAAELDSLNMRYSVLQAFNEVGKLEMVPLKYRTPQEFARLVLYGYAEEEYNTPVSMSLLGEVKDGQKTYYAFTLAYTEEGVKKEYLGIGGGGDHKAGKLDFEGTVGYSNFDLKEQDWKAQAQKMIAGLKESE